MVPPAKNCPNVLSKGSCDDTRCAYNHNIPTCDICSLVFQTDAAYKQHLTSDGHRNRVSGSSVLSHCPVCKINITGGQKHWKQHLKGRKHLSKAAALNVPSHMEPQIGSSTSKETYCELCQILVVNPAWKAHLKGDKHKKRKTFACFKTAIEGAEADSHGVTVEGVFNFGVVSPQVAKSGVKTVGGIKTTQPSTKCNLVSFRLASAHGVRPFNSGFTVEAQNGSTTLSAKPLVLNITFKQAFNGRYEDRLELVFQDTQLKQQFIIIRTLKAIVGDKALHDQLQPKTPYVPRSQARGERKEIKEVVEGVKPPALKAIPYVVTLPKAEIPVQLRTLLQGSESIGRVTKTIKSTFLPGVLNSKTHPQFFKQLLWIEESQTEQDLEKFDIFNITLQRRNRYYSLEVPGLAEKRPSVLVGDCILVQEQGATNGRWFEGHVHAVHKAEVDLCFHTSFARYNEGQRFHVRFKLNRIPMRRQHQAMDAVFLEERVLFPLVSHLASGRVQTSRDVHLSLHNPLISNNPPQLQAVTSIITRPPGSPPFIIFGPPGTGKTITVVESIRQLLSRNPSAKILACAPSNSAADLIAIRLKNGLSPQELFRFYAPSRHKEQLPNELKDYSYIDSNGHFAIPPPAKVRMNDFRVIVTTCLSASVAHGIGMKRGAFSHIFIDEAGQATEPEVLVSVKTMADAKTNIVLSGDPKQLGPIIRSGIAVELGLEQSYLERLMNRDCYNLTTGYGKSVVKLTKNFRSHNAILKFPNETFYNGDLQQCADPNTINFYLNSAILPSKKFPIIFHAVSGQDEREASSPSFFNRDEVGVVKSYVEKLKEDRKTRTAGADIGVITPYHSQCKKLRVALNTSSEDPIKVGSVEEFQGQERKVVIISTVRSSKEFVEYDIRHTLGFVASPRRFNVAVTRAKALLIVVGDPQVLGLDPLWRLFLNYVHLNGGWAGPDIPWDPKLPVDNNGGYDKAIQEGAKLDMNEFTRRLESMTMADVDNEIGASVDHPLGDLE